MTPPGAAGTGAPAESSSPKRAIIRELAVAWLHLAVLWMFAFARPLFQVLEDSPAFFVARGNTTLDIVLLALGAAFVPPTLLVLCEAVLIPLRAARRALHLVFIAVLVAAIVLQALDGLAGGPALLLIAAALAIGAAGAWAYARTRFAPAVLTVLSPVPALLVAYFLLLSPVSDLVLPEDVEAAGAGKSRSSTPVVFVVFDELSGASLADASGKVDSSRFPNLAAFSGDSTWYPNATTVADETTAAVPALLSGQRPVEGKLPIASDHPVNLFTALEDSHSLNVVEPATDLCPERLCSQARPSLRSRLRALADDLSVVSAYQLLPADLEDGLPEVDRTFAGFREGGRDDAPESAGIPAAGLEDRPGQFAQYMRGIDGAASKPQLDFLHLALPHFPWQYLPSGQSYDVAGPDPPGLSSEHWSPDPWLSRQGYQRYLLQLGYVDRLLGRLIDRLRAEGLYDRSLIVVTADHGISFRADLNRRVVVPGNAPDIANVPLFVKQPGQESGRVDKGHARTIDLLPTVAQAVGIRLGGEVDGRPLGRAGGSEDRVRVSSYTGNPVELSFGDFVRRRDAEVARRLRLFPGEGFDGVFASAPSAGLVGERVRSVPAGARPDFRVELDFRSGFAAFSPASPSVPAFVTGRVTGAAEAGELMAIAVNGRIAAVTKSFRDGPDIRVGAMISPRALRTGANRVDALAVTGSGATLRLARVGSTGGEDASLVRDGEDLVMVIGGDRIPVSPGAADGWLDASSAGDTATISGWATDARHRRAADRVLLFEDGRLVEATAPSVVRADVAKEFESLGVAKSGFRFTGVSGGSEAVRSGQLVAVALAGEGASELKLPR